MQLSTLPLGCHALLVRCCLGRREDIALAGHLVERRIRLAGHLGLVAGHAGRGLVLPCRLRTRLLLLLELLAVALLLRLVLLMICPRAALRAGRLHFSGVRRAASIEAHAAHLRGEAALLLLLLRMHLLLLLRHHGPALWPARLPGRHWRASAKLLWHLWHAWCRADAATLGMLAGWAGREAAGAWRRLSRLQRTRATAAGRHHARLSRHAGRRHRTALLVRAGASWPRHALRMRCQALLRRWRESTPLWAAWRSWWTSCTRRDSQYRC